MEGGKRMKTRLIIKSIFVFFLSVILICLVIIIFDKAGTGAGIYNPPKLVDYVIVDKTEVCTDVLELIYSDKKYNYYLPCQKSSTVFLEWDEGVTDPLRFAIENEKVTIDSLIDHGLGVIKDEKKD